MLAAAKVDNLDYESTVVAENFDRSFIHRDLFRIPRGQTSSLQVRVQKLEDVNVHQHPLIRCLTNCHRHQQQIAQRAREIKALSEDRGPTVVAPRS